MRPTNGDDVEVAVAVGVEKLRAVVVFVARGDEVLLPTAVAVLEDKNATGVWVRQVVLADDHIHVAVAIEVAHVKALRPDGRADGMLGPQRGRVGRLLIPRHRPVDADALKADDRVQIAVAVHVDQAVAVGFVTGGEERVVGPGGGVLQPLFAQKQIQVAVVVDVSRADLFAGGRGRERPQ